MIHIKDNSGKIIQSVESVRGAARWIGVSHPAVLKALRKNRPIHNKYYIEKVEDEIINETSPNDYSNETVPSAWSAELGRFLNIEEFCSKYGLPYHEVKSYKLVDHNVSHMTYNIVFYTQEEDRLINLSEIFEDTVKKYIKPRDRRINVAMSRPDNMIDRLVYTDVHIAMDVNDDGDPLYDGEWNRDELMARLDDMIAHVLKHKSSNILYVDDLGDLMDGLNGKTARGEHELPQNMNSKEAFDLALEFKMELLEGLIPYYNRIIFHNVNNDNHSAAFGYFVNSAFKMIAETKYKYSVEVHNEKRFISHYSVGKLTFLLSHGKDSKNLKFSFKPVLDQKQIEKIDQYCKIHKLYDGNDIEFSKGDSHQLIFDYTTSNDFSYCSYPAFSPPSNWVKTNFKPTKSGFVFYNIDSETKQKSIIPYFFDDNN